MSIEIINLAISKGAELVGNISGGKDGQAMVKTLHDQGYKFKALLHCDLGRVEWPESMAQCEKQQAEIKAPLLIVKRSDGRDMLDHWKHRLLQLKGTGKPFWSSSENRYCTSDLKRDPSNVAFRNMDNSFIISCEGIRAAESIDRAKKNPLTIRWKIVAAYYKNLPEIVTRLKEIERRKKLLRRKGSSKNVKFRHSMFIRSLENEIVKICVENYKPGHRLCLTWFPIFNFSLEEVWLTYLTSVELVAKARADYRLYKEVPAWWPFHPAYVYGNERVSCMFCIMGCKGDLENAAKHNPALLQEMISMEEEGAATFQNNWSLKELLKN